MKCALIASALSAVFLSFSAFGDGCAEQCKREARQDQLQCKSGYEQCIASSGDVGSNVCRKEQEQCVAQVGFSLQFCVEHCSAPDFPLEPSY